ncbi:MAG: hypothetical protein M0Z36_06705 [Thermaerobacter sp.]|nr:hypothetical protein [Thermaerobacter sp.]
MAKEDAPRYLLPKPTRRGYEVMPGWGLTEFAVIGIGAGIGALLALVASLVGLPVPFVAVVGILPPAVAVFAAFPPPSGEPLYRQMLAAWDYLHHPRVYIYDWTAGDD